ncbi:DUF6473 family protein [Paracoccaceae bacterium GXU_MW_L88]
MGESIKAAQREAVMDIAGALSCHKFGTMAQLYRGAALQPIKPYIACLGSSETYARNISVPWPGLLAKRIDLQVMNWAQNGAGPGYYLRDADMIAALNRAKLTIVTVMPAHFLSNRLYSVLDRRNQMLKDVSEMATALFPELEFHRFETVNEMMHAMHKQSAERFRVLDVELKGAYIARMRDLLQLVEGRKLLLWLSPRRPGGRAMDMQADDCGPLPQFVTTEMMEAIRPYADHYVEHILPRDTEGSALTPEDHANIAEHLQPEVERLTHIRGRGPSGSGLRGLFGF